MTLRTARLKVANVLANKWRSPSKMTKLSRWGRFRPTFPKLAERIRPKGPRLPKGFKRIPKQWLNDDARDVLEHVAARIRRYRAFKKSTLWIGATLGIGATAATYKGLAYLMAKTKGNEALAGTLTATGLIVMGGSAIGGFVTPMFLATKFERSIVSELGWLQQYFRATVRNKSAHPKIQELFHSKKYNFFVIENGELAVTNEPKEATGLLFGNEKRVTVINTQNGKIIYQGPLTTEVELDYNPHSPRSKYKIEHEE